MADDASERLRTLLQRIVDELDLDAEVEIAEDGDTITGTLDGEELGLFIGRHGSTIEAVQHLAAAPPRDGRGSPRRR